MDWTREVLRAEMGSQSGKRGNGGRRLSKRFQWANAEDRRGRLPGFPRCRFRARRDIGPVALGAVDAGSSVWRAGVAFNSTPEQEPILAPPDPSAGVPSGMARERAPRTSPSWPASRPATAPRVKLLTFPRAATAEERKRLTGLSRGTAEPQSAPIIFICGTMQGISYRRVTGIRLTGARCWRN